MLRPPQDQEWSVAFSSIVAMGARTPQCGWWGFFCMLCVTDSRLHTFPIAGRRHIVDKKGSDTGGEGTGRRPMTADDTLVGRAAVLHPSWLYRCLTRQAGDTPSTSCNVHVSYRHFKQRPHLRNHCQRVKLHRTK